MKGHCYISALHVDSDAMMQCKLPVLAYMIYKLVIKQDSSVYVPWPVQNDIFHMIFHVVFNSLIYIHSLSLIFIFASVKSMTSWSGYTKHFN